MTTKIRDGDIVRSKEHEKLGQVQSGIVKWYDVYGQRGEDEVEAVANNLLIVEEIQEDSKVIIMNESELLEEKKYLESLLYNYNRNVRHVNKRFRFPIEEIDETIENRRQVKMKHFDLDIERRSLVEKMEASQEYNDMQRVDLMLATLSSGDAYILKERYQYRASYEKIGKALKYDKSSVYRQIDQILENLLQKL